MLHETNDRKLEDTYFVPPEQNIPEAQDLWEELATT